MKFLNKFGNAMVLRCRSEQAHLAVPRMTTASQRFLASGRLSRLLKKAGS
jgi:hypothetical protein